MLFQIKSYLNFLWRSTNQHGIHSPFVYNLVTKCFYDKKDYPEYKILDQYRKSLLNNKSEISVTDFGVGSKVFKSNVRSIGAIARNAGITEKRAHLLLRIACYLDAKDILEVGTSVGLATAALSLANKNSVITSLEGCPATAAVAASALNKISHNVKVVETEFSLFLSSEAVHKKFDLIYFDGNHSKAATLKYVEMLLPTVRNETVWIFDDIHWSDEMQQAWCEIQAHPLVRVTIDTYQWGIVFFRREQEKENFAVRV
ncbi:MAG: class I SAM-dependent methyltransferase [Flavobacterium sp.]|nr:class I SAM-dependent methyltransferase [Flavobacterium sp.]